MCTHLIPHSSQDTFQSLVHAAEQVSVGHRMCVTPRAVHPYTHYAPLHSLQSPLLLHGKVVIRFSSTHTLAATFIYCQPHTTCGQVCAVQSVNKLCKTMNPSPYIPHPPRTGVLDGFYRWPHPFHDNLRLVHHNRMSTSVIPETEEHCGEQTPGFYCTACCRRMVWLRGRVRAVLASHVR